MSSSKPLINSIYDLDDIDTEEHKNTATITPSPITAVDIPLLTIDDRERFVLDIFKKSKQEDWFKYVISRIYIGDFIISYNNVIKIAIERKTWADLASTLRSSRKENIHKLLSLREQTGCVLMYIIEGNPLPNPSSKVSKMPYSNMISHLDHIMLRDKIHVIHTKDHYHTFLRLQTLMKNMLSIKDFNKPVRNNGDDVVGGKEEEEPNDMNIIKTSIKPTETQITYDIWSSIPNISVRIAGIFIKHGVRLLDMIMSKITEDDISTLKYDSGMIIGKVRSKKILKAITETSSHISILSNIPMISKKTATAVLQHTPLITLINDTSLDQDLCSIKITEHSTLGEKKLKLIRYWIAKS